MTVRSDRMETLRTQLLEEIRKAILADITHNSILLAKLHIHRIRELKQVHSLHEVEFKTFSQWGEDGIIQYLINNVPIANNTFVEFGVQDYTESNTRLLLTNDNWKGLVIDGNNHHIEYIQNDDIYWRYALTAVCHFITRDNICQIISSAGITGDIGLLSIDIDGNDYWVWEAIDVVNPRIVVCEYNSVFGSDHAITIPYDADFQRTKAHYSDLYFGASLPALCILAEKKGYDFCGTNSTGINAFFVRKDFSHNINTLTAKEGYVLSHVRESRDILGNRTYISGQDRFDVMGDLKVIDIMSNSLVTLRDLKTEQN